MKKIQLASGFSIPQIGLGTWLLTGRECFEAVSTALDFGYTLIDTAVAYDNEQDIGKAIEESGINRSDLFLTTKVWYQKLRAKDVVDQCNRSLDYLRTDYIDLLLIHWPNKYIPMRETFEGFEQLVEERKVRSAGISNFTIRHIQEAKKSTVLKLSINQVEFHPFLYQKELLQYCNGNSISVMAYSPLGRGKVFHSELLKEIADDKGAEVSQIVLAWLMRKNIIVIPKASSDEHLKANLDSMEIELSDHESSLIDSISENERIIKPSWAEFED